MKKGAILTEGAVSSVLFKQTVPMIFGMLSIVIFNLVDTYFLGQISPLHLAAITYTFPVVMVINSIAFGIGMGSSAVLSRSVGSGDHEKVKQIATDSLILAFTLVLIFSITGIFTIRPLFTLLGAEGMVLDLVEEYMSVWYFGMMFVVIPMVGNNAIRALGDSKTPGIVMSVGAIINSFLDPVLIFGVGFIPAMGMKGAAIATVVGRMISFVVALYVLGVREKLLILHRRAFSNMIASFKEILHVGIPNAGTRMVMPLGVGIITRMLSGYGDHVVAGFGVASRIDFFATSIIMALGSIFGPFVGQNWGANKVPRIKEGVHYITRFSLWNGFVIFAFFLIFAPYITPLFNDHPEVIAVATDYLYIVPAAYVFFGLLIITNAAFNTLNHPLKASVLIMLQMFVIYIPLSYLLNSLMGVTGFFIALTLSYLISGILSLGIFQRIFLKDVVV